MIRTHEGFQRDRLWSERLEVDVQAFKSVQEFSKDHVGNLFWRLLTVEPHSLLTSDLGVGAIYMLWD